MHSQKLHDDSSEASIPKMRWSAHQCCKWKVCFSPMSHRRWVKSLQRQIHSVFDHLAKKWISHVRFPSLYLPTAPQDRGGKGTLPAFYFFPISSIIFESSCLKLLLNLFQSNLDWHKNYSIKIRALSHMTHGWKTLEINCS